MAKTVKNSEAVLRSRRKKSVTGTITPSDAMSPATNRMKFRHDCSNAEPSTPRLPPVAATTGYFSCSVTLRVLVPTRALR